MKCKLLFVLLLNTLVLVAQKVPLMINGANNTMHLLHTVQAKENWYSVGRLYNIGPKDMAAFNNTSIDKALAIGQPLKVPLTTVNFSQNNSKEADEVFVPVYHVVQEKEWMYRISTNYNKVPVETIEKWNNISKDNAKAGTRLIIGYLKVKNSQSDLAKYSKAVPADVVVKEEKKETAPPPIVKEEKKVAPPPVLEEKKPEPIKTEEPRIVPKPADKNPVIDKNGGFFIKEYAEVGKTINGTAGIFKSNSGWSDTKYYALMNNVPTGTIIKVSSEASGKAVYAKVLGGLPDMKESAGLTIRLSDAAASILGAATGKFFVAIKY